MAIVFILIIELMNEAKLEHRWKTESTGRHFRLNKGRLCGSEADECHTKKKQPSSASRFAMVV